MPHTLIDHYRAMARNNAWSNARLLEACKQLSDEAFAARRGSFFASLQMTLNHTLLVDRYYLADPKGEAWRIQENKIPHPRAIDLAAAQAAQDRELVAFCDALTEPDLDRIVPIDRKDSIAYRETMRSILAHLFAHQIHHRGQAHAILAGTKVAPPQLDEFLLASHAPGRASRLARLGLSDFVGA